MQSDSYEKLIHKIRVTRYCVIAATIIIVLALICLSAPMELVILGDEVVSTDGLINPILAVVLIVLTLFAELIVCAIVYLPLTTSLTDECDPEKCLILNRELRGNKGSDSIYAACFLTIGDFEQTIYFADKLIAKGKSNYIKVGILYKARALFFLKDYPAMKSLVAQYLSILDSEKSGSERARAEELHFANVLKLLSAIADGDSESISALAKSIEPWNSSRLVLGFIDYMRGLAAYLTNNKENCIFRLKSAVDICPKTVFAKSAEEYLEKLKDA